MSQPNIYYTAVGDIQRIKVPIPGGFDLLQFAPIEHIDWSLTANGVFRPQLTTGKVSLAEVGLLSGKSWLNAFVPKAKTAYREETLSADAGSYIETFCECFIPFYSETNLMRLDVLKYHHFIVKVQLQSGLVKLLGNKNDGVTLTLSTSTGEGPKGIPGSAARFTWHSEDFPPLAV